RSGWIRSSVPVIEIRLPVRGRFGKAPGMGRIVCVLAVALTACWGQPASDKQRQPAAAPTSSPTPAPTSTTSAHASAATTGSGARSVSEETDDFLFEYSYPKEAGHIPEL